MNRKDLQSRLEREKQEKLKCIKEFNRVQKRVGASVIIVTFNIEKNEFKKTLQALENQTTDDFEVIIIDNGNRWDIKPLLQEHMKVNCYVELKRNFGLNFGRNLGAQLSRGELLIFLDDDAVPRKDFVEQHMKIYKKRNIIALRGRIVPKTNSIYNKLQSHYDLGEETFPYFINTEGNSSIKREVFQKFSGFRDELAKAGGYEGRELTFRLVNSKYEEKDIIYYPKAVIYHDYVSGLFSFLRKQIRHNVYEKTLRDNFPPLFKFTHIYNKYNKTSERRFDSILEKILITIIWKLSNLLIFFINKLTK